MSRTLRPLLPLLPACACLFGGGTAGAQNPRDPQALDSSAFVTAADPSAASEGELSVVLYRRDAEVIACTSSGRGLAWSSPVRVDQDPTGSAKWVGAEGASASVAVAGGWIHALWRDRRNGEDDLWYRRSRDGGSTWDPEVRLDKAYPSGTAPVREYALAATTVGSAVHVHVLFTVDPGAGGAFLPDELYAVRSTDGGGTWSPALPVSSANGSGADVDSFALDVKGPDVVYVWSDDRFGASTADDLWLRHSTDSGATFLGPEVQVDPSGPLLGDVENEIVLASEDDVLAIAWEEEFGSVREEAWVTVSPDRGASFAPGQRVGQYPPSSSDVDDVTLAVQDGIVFVGWDDDRTGVDQTRVARSLDAGATWIGERTLSSTGGNALRLVACDDVLTATWSGDASAGTGERARASYSRDGGATWSTPCDLSTNSGDVDMPHPVWNHLYGNLIVPWLADDTGTNEVWVGGLRPQHLIPVNWTSGGLVRVDFAGFDGNAALVWAFASRSPGTLALGLGDGRDLGLRPDATLQFTAMNPQFFAASLDPSGSGSTPSLRLTESPGAVFHVAAVSFRLAPLGLAEVTDVVRVTVQ